MGLVKLSVGVDRIGQAFCRCGWDWSSFSEEGMGLVKLPVGVDGIGHTFSRSEIYQTFCGIEWD